MEKTYKLLPFQCNHIRLEFKPDRDKPKLVVCKDCGAILFIQINPTQSATFTNRVPIVGKRVRP